MLQQRIIRVTGQRKASCHGGGAGLLFLGQFEGHQPLGLAQRHGGGVRLHAAWPQIGKGIEQQIGKAWIGAKRAGLPGQPGDGAVQPRARHMYPERQTPPGEAAFCRCGQHRLGIGKPTGREKPAHRLQPVSGPLRRMLQQRIIRVTGRQVFELRRWSCHPNTHLTMRQRRAHLPGGHRQPAPNERQA